MRLFRLKIGFFFPKNSLYMERNIFFMLRTNNNERELQPRTLWSALMVGSVGDTTADLNLRFCGADTQYVQRGADNNRWGYNVGMNGTYLSR